MPSFPVKHSISSLLMLQFIVHHNLIVVGLSFSSDTDVHYFRWRYSQVIDLDDKTHRRAASLPPPSPVEV